MLDLQIYILFYAQQTKAVVSLLLVQKQACVRYDYNFYLKMQPKLVMMHKNIMWFGFVCLPTGEMASLSAESVISGNTVDNLIVQPLGSGEINMIQMTLPVIATVYLDKTNQWQMIGFEKRDEALGHIQTGG